MITQARDESGERISLHDYAGSRLIRGSYDAARTTTEFSNYWANSDSYDADTSNERSVRETLVSRSRYETQNNGYADGIAQTYATALVGTGPKLRMLSGSTGFNALVEAEWERWASRVMLSRKLWAQAHAKHQDGEGFGVARTNLGVRHPVMLDYVLYETEQFQSPQVSFLEPGKIDGIEFDEYGNPSIYELLKYHPGSRHGYSVLYEAERLPARFVMHWFLLRRPGQHRAVPECSSTLNVGAASRRWREATIAAAETAADFSAILKTAFEPDNVDQVTPLESIDIQKRMMTALPQGWELSQLKAEHPTSTYDMLQRALLNEQARPRSMPYNVAACDSADYNYASGRLDHQTYHGALDVDRKDCGTLVLSPLFDIWFEEAVRVFGWLGGDPTALSAAATNHKWDWPKHRVADVQAEAKANEVRLRTGQVTPSELYAEQGKDYEDQITLMASDYGLTVPEMKTVLLQSVFPSAVSAQQPEQSDTGDTEDD